ncbi:MAG: tetratricopeptide repeat protein [Pseudomonadota bacterium]
MAKMTLNAVLSQALALIQRGEPARALQGLESLPPRAREDANVLHVRGLAYKASGDLTRARELLGKAVRKLPRHPALLNNFANVLNDLGEREEAAETYAKATAAQPDFLDGHRNLGIVLGALGEHERALTSLGEAKRLAPNDARTLSALGATLNALERPEEAERVLRELLQRVPDHAIALHHLGVSLRLQERLDEAVQVLQDAQTAAPQRPEIVHAAATLAFDRGEHEDAERAYQRAIALRPDYVDAHETLNELYWQRGQLERYGESYAEVHREHGWLSPALSAAWMRCLVLANRIEDALRVGREARETFGPQVATLRWEAQAHRAVGRSSDMLKALEEAVRVMPRGGADRRQAITLRQDLVEGLLREGEPQRADAIVDELLALAPDDQLSWAWRGTVWRQLDDQRYHDLQQDLRFVRAWQLPTPEGYDSLSSFLSAVTQTLQSMHQMVVRPLAQTLENGTQTPGRLLHKPDPVIQALRGAIASVLDEYVAELPRDDRHPLLRRCTGRWRLSGSWSVRLQPNGFHVDHVHPAGWVSSACYISLPPNLGADRAQTEQIEAPDRAGWIRFGRSSLALPERDGAERYVQPEPGLLVLFPSFTWHGTVPFHGSPKDFRMTAPFDAVPA